jgi:hypothetical protein
LEDPGIHWWTILKHMLRRLVWGIDWIDLAHNRDTWRAVAMAVINLRVP